MDTINTAIYRNHPHIRSNSQACHPPYNPCAPPPEQISLSSAHWWSCNDHDRARTGDRGDISSLSSLGREDDCDGEGGASAGLLSADKHTAWCRSIDEPLSTSHRAPALQSASAPAAAFACVLVLASAPGATFARITAKQRRLRAPVLHYTLGQPPMVAHPC